MPTHDSLPHLTPEERALHDDVAAEHGNVSLVEKQWVLAILTALNEARGELVKWTLRHCEPRIADRCPSCGLTSLFIAVGGYLTCGNLKCKEPGVTRAFASAEAVRDTAIAERDELKQQVDALRSLPRPLGYVCGQHMHLMSKCPACERDALRAELERMKGSDNASPNQMP